MRKFLLCVVIVFLPTIFFGQDIEVTTKDGRTVILKENGTWKYKTEKEKSDETTNNSQKIGTNLTNKISSFDNKLPFNDFEAKSIPFNFDGHDMTEICGVIKERFKSKDEFETTAAYEKRIAEAGKTNIYEKLPIDSILAYEKNPEGLFGRYYDGIIYRLNYDADKSQMSVTIISENILQDYKPIIEIERAYGCKIYFDNLEKYFTDSRRAFSTRNERTFSINFNISAEEAKDLKENLQLLYLFNLKPPFSPYNTVNSNLSEIWLFSRITKKVVFKLKVSSLKEINSEKN